MCHTRDQAEQVKAPAGRVADPKRAGLQRGQDPHRPRRTTASTSWGSTSAATDGKLLIKPSKAAVKRIRKRLAAEVRSLRGSQRRGGDPQAQPDHPGLGRLLPERGLQGGVHRAGPLPVATHSTGGRCAPTRTSRSTGSSTRYFGMFNKSRTDRWVFGDRDSGAYLRQVRLDQDRPPPDGQGHRVTRRPGPGPVLGTAAAQDALAARRSAPPPCCSGSTGAARSAERSCCTPTTNHSPHASGNSGLGP